MQKRRRTKGQPVTVTRFTPCHDPRVPLYAPAKQKTVTVSYMARDESEPPYDFETTLPPGYVQEQDYVIYRPPESRSKYDPVTLDARTWTRRDHMYDAFIRELGFAFPNGQTLDALLDLLCACRFRITVLWACVPAYHMRDYFETVLELMYQTRALERVYNQDVRDEIEDWIEVDFTAGDTPARPFRNPPREYFDMPPLEEMW